MKRRADMLIGDKYKRITIWDALEYKKNQPDFWKEHKEKIYTISKKPENKVRLVFNTGKNGVLENSYFSYYNAELARNHDGSEESYVHEFFKECLTRIKQLELRWYGESLTIFPDEFLPEEELVLKDGSKRRVDLLIKFSKSEPECYYEKWDGQLAFEIFYSHKVDEKKIKQFKANEIACFEFNVKKWKVKEWFKNEEDEEEYIDTIAEKLDGINHGYIRGELIVDPISSKYFATEKYLQMKEEKENIEKMLQESKALLLREREKNRALTEELTKYKLKISENKSRMLELAEKVNEKESELASVKQTIWYKIFSKG